MADPNTSNNNSSNQKSPPSMATGKKIPVSAIVLSLALPLVVCKSLIVYFGSKYTAEPGEGYGYGLIIMILFSLGTAGRFIWKYRNYSNQ